ncbi:unnamed protein product [Zymoseptoria tritici ST99CH_3D7]|uniref:BTB domain-containing protein n=1 Tax=Zymoseptoria tritici (strain ST99CH_3D7) TaxID=1276538 RepID=A0A1X7S572_ZYMT9|nr:unnamed protein product [Zymoseptoria tritici ST99CH_3D7]
MTIQSLTDATTRLSLDQKYADLEIHCGGQVFKVHRAVVCSASAVMAAQYDCGDRHDGITIITLDDIDAKAMNSMLQFIYHGTYSLDGAVIMSTARQSEPSAIQSRTALEKNHPGRLKDTLLAHAQVGNLAASYQLPELETLAQECFSAARCKGTMLKPEEMIEIAGEVYVRPSENEGLHAIVLEIILEHADQYLNDCGFIDCIMKDEGLQDLAMDILAAVALRLKEDSDEVHTCQNKNSDLMKSLETARAELRSVSSVLQKKEELHKTTLKQLQADNQRLHDQMAAKEDTANARLNEETMKTKQECEERIMRIRLQAKDQDRLRCDQISDATKRLTQADGSLASTKMELKALRSTQATSETKVIELEEQVRCSQELLSEAVESARRDRTSFEVRTSLIKEQAKVQDKKRHEEIADITGRFMRADDELSLTKLELTAVQNAKAASDTTILDLQNKNRHLFQKMQEYQQSLAGPQNQLVKVNTSLQKAQNHASEQVAYVASQKKEIKRLEDKLWDAKKSAELQSKNERLNRKLGEGQSGSWVERAVARQLVDFDNINVCRHCGEDFEYYLEREGDYGYVARCSECTTRHHGRDGVI